MTNEEKYRHRRGRYRITGKAIREVEKKRRAVRRAGGAAAKIKRFAEAKKR